MLVLPLGALGVLIGAVVAAVTASYGTDRRVWPWPRGRVCNHDASPRSLLTCARAVIRPRHRRDDAPMPHALWVEVMMAAVFCGLGVRYATEPLLLVISLVEATLLLLLLVIDLDQCLVPTPVVGLLVAVALVSANLWPGLSLPNALVGGAIAFVGFALLVGVARLLCGADALGLGDAALALAIGCITGYPRVVGTLGFGIILGGVGAGALLLLRRRELRQAIPYGPFLIAATIYVLIHGNTLP